MIWLKTILGWVAGRREPQHTGEITTAGLRGPVTIRRDRYAIPYLEAEHELDGWFGLGFCQGQDRAFQLETIQRIGRGTLAELVGPEGLPIDRLSRKIGFFRSASVQLGVQSPATRELVAAFCAGVNAGRTQGLPDRPHELWLLGGQFTPYTPADVLAFLKFTSFLLPSNWDVELARLTILQQDGPDAVRDLDPTLGFPREAAEAPGVSATAGAIRSVAWATFERELAALQRVWPRGGGSNNWVLAGSRTASGKPIVANDPHLGPTLPAPWYLAQLQLPDYRVAGATFVGCPAIIIGHNEEAAWGVTAGLQDNSDWWIEPLGHTESQSPAEEILTHEEIIAVRGQPDETLKVQSTPRGPVVIPGTPGGSPGLALHAVWLQPRPLDGFLGAQRETNYVAFRSHFECWPVLPLNIVYADRTGTIGGFLCGETPQRPDGVGLWPRPVEQPGPVNTELVPFARMPHQQNPADGFLATANAAPRTEVWLGADFIDPYREATLREELARYRQWNVESCLALQQNLRSLPWEALRPIVLGLARSGDEARLQEAFTLLTAWNGHIDADSPAAAIFELWQARVIRALTQARAPKSWLVALGGDGENLLQSNLFSDRRTAHLVRLLQTQPEGWFPQGWPDTLREALRLTMQELYESYGPGPSWWQWGDLRPLHLKHTILGKHRWLGPIFNAPPVPIGGDATTISHAGARPADPTGPTHNFANLRCVMDLSDWSLSRVVLAGGQVGNPYSVHHQDQLALWLRGEAVPLLWNRDDILKQCKATLRLNPGNDPS